VVLKERIMRRKIVICLLIAAEGALVTILVLTQHALPSVANMAGSSLISNIIQDIAGDKVETRILIPPGKCPGHCDIKPRDIRALANSRAFFIHSFQANFTYITDLIEAADNPDLITRAINEAV
jgi:ABC-type Zn uptake system ZnuABC Zn-binding protein ZnuA